MPRSTSKANKSTPTLTPEWVVDIIRELPSVLTFKEVVRVTRFSDRHLRRCIENGRLQVIRTSATGPLRIARTAVADFLLGMAS